MQPIPKHRPPRGPSPGGASRRALALAVSGLLGVGMALGSASVRGEPREDTARRHYAIAAGPLLSVLPQFAAAAGVGLSFAPALVAGRGSAGVRGSYDVDGGFAELLAGTGLEAVRDPAGGYVLRSQPRSGSGPATLAAVTVKDSVLSAYLADVPSSVATRTVLSPRHTPFTLNQAGEALMRERGDTTLYDSLEYFAGVTTASGNGDIGQGMSRNVNVRGFSTSGANQLLVNGQRSYSTAGEFRSADNLEQVEVLRGPAGLYYGAAEPGGIINYRYKQPRAERAHVLRLETDDKGSAGGMVDLTGPLDEQGVLLYRLVGSRKRHQDDQDHIWSEPRSGFAAFTLKPDDSFSTTLTYEWLKVEAVPEQENNMRVTNPASPYYGQYYPVPRDFFWGSRNDRAVRETETVLWEASWSRSEAFRLQASANYQGYEQWWQNTRVSNAGNGPDADGNVARYVSGRQNRGHSYALALDLSGIARLGNWRHDWLLGLSHGRTEGRSSGRKVASQSRPGQPYEVGPINIFDPVYRDYPYQYRIWDDPLGPTSARSDRNAYLQSLVHLPDGRSRFLLAAGWAEYRSEPAGAARQTVRKWSPRLALMHDFSDSLTAYLSYGESFSPQADLSLLDMAGRYLTTPEEAAQYELGFKQDLFDGKAMLTAALFQIEKRKVAMAAQAEGECDDGAAAAPGTPGGTDGSGDCRYTLSGLQRSRGAELSLSGEITHWWSAQLAYSYTWAEYVETDDVWARGRSLANMPVHSLALWNKFLLHQDAALGDLSLGLGLRAWSKVHNAWRDPASHMRATRSDWNPGYGLVDLGLYWDKRLAGRQAFRLALNISNLLDKTYYDRSRFAAGNTVVWGNGRRATLSAQLSF